MRDSTITIENYYQFINPSERSLPREAVGGIQLGFFSSFFGQLAAGPLCYASQCAMMPISAIISAVKFRYDLCKYQSANNRNLNTKSAIFWSALGMSVGITVAMISLVPLLATAAAFIPVIFIAVIGINFLSSAFKTAYHGYRMLRLKLEGKDFTAGYAYHKEKLIKNAIKTVISGVIGAAIGVILFSPAVIGVTIAAAIALVVKIATVAITGSLALATLGNVIKGYRVKNEKQENYQHKLEFDSNKREKYSEKEFGLESHVDDLLYKMDSICNMTGVKQAKNFVARLMQDEKERVLKCADPYKREQKLHFLCSLETLLHGKHAQSSVSELLKVKGLNKLTIFNSHFERTGGMQKIAVLHDKHAQSSVSELLKVKGLNKLTIFNSHFERTGGMQKIAVLVEYYLQLKAKHESKPQTPRV